MLIGKKITESESVLLGLLLDGLDRDEDGCKRQVYHDNNEINHCHIELV